MYSLQEGSVAYLPLVPCLWVSSNLSLPCYWHKPEDSQGQGGQKIGGGEYVSGIHNCSSSLEMTACSAIPLPKFHVFGLCYEIHFHGVQ